MPADRGPTILLLGRDGQLGWELHRTLAPLARIIAPARAELDLRDAQALDAFARGCGAHAIVNAAAHTDVDGAETEREAAFAVNADAPATLARAAAETGALLVHFSTDYVFDGRARTAYREDDATAPINVYGESKLAGERAIRDVGGAHVILRTSWLYGLRGRNFMRTVLRLAREREELAIVDDQIGCPTWCRMVAEAVTALIARLSTGQGFDLPSRLGGTYHLCAAGRASWCDFAAAILERASRTDARACRVRPIPTRDFPRAAARPAFSVLDCGRFEEAFGMRLPHWRDQLDLALDGAHALERALESSAGAASAAARPDS